MTWKFSSFLAILTCSLVGKAYAVMNSQSSFPLQTFNPNPYPTKRRLTFRPDGTFKLMVFSDLHFGEKIDQLHPRSLNLTLKLGENPAGDWGPEQDRNSSILMRKVLADEKPDYAVLNGDLITGENTYRENSTSLIDKIMAPLNEAKVPFSSTHGNHDNQVNITHAQEIRREQCVAPLSYTRFAPPGVGGKSGPGTYWVPVYSQLRDPEPSLILWFFDSRGGFSPDSQPLPDYVDSSVADYIAHEVKGMNAAWGPAKNRGALAFVHIPPHLIQAVQGTLDSTKNPGLNADALGQGATQDTSNGDSTGKDKPFWDALNKHVKNLHAVISGHDHGNEWCAREPEKDVIFCFDKHSGYGGYGQPDWGYGVRNIVFSSPDPKQPVETWIRLEGGQVRAKVTLDGNYGR